jgi:DNA-binding transcriptional ArsR family regulator
MDQSENPVDAKRRPATIKEAKALAHPLRVRMVRLLGQYELTNKQLADRLGIDPGTSHYHVKQLLDAAFIEPAPVRTGESGALEKPYRSTGRTWWLSDALDVADVDESFAPIEAFQQELAEAGPRSIATYARFSLHLSPEDVVELDRRIVAVLDDYVETDDLRSDRPVHGGLFVLHRSAD